ncbi:cbb3-type cytochrome c oxidase N-terminal domain-containing protein [Flaviaesturariibacter flavus]|nr:cbb3-type cytochrome c oxidase N-terminal domain-containing protein [Flaviaesturariibacter flavus]
MKRNNCLRYSLLLAATLGAGLIARAEDGTAVQLKETTGSSINGYLLLDVLFFLLLVLLPVMRRMAGLINPKEEAAPRTLRQWWSDLNHRTLTRSIPLDQEEAHLLDHEYDGIRELDNSLPPWWKWGFYISAVLSVAYFVYYTYGSGMNPEQEYAAEMKQAALDIEAYRKLANDNVDEKTVTMADAAGIAKGKEVFLKNCFMCHGSNGEGGVGPNLTDDYWLHGGSINDVFKTIKYGYPDKGMQSWQKMLSPGEIKNIASFVKSLRGSKPANGKAPQGEEYKEGGAPVAAKDSSNAVAAK